MRKRKFSADFTKLLLIHLTIIIISIICYFFTIDICVYELIIPRKVIHPLVIAASLYKIIFDTRKKWLLVQMSENTTPSSTPKFLPRHPYLNMNSSINSISLGMC